MELANKPVSSPSQSWIKKAEKRHSPRSEYYSELRSWLQHAIMEADKNGNFEKKGQLLSLLKEL
jgi:hypothetical protein